MVGQLRRQRAFYREGLIDELFVKGFFGLVNHDHCHAVLVVLRASRSTHHLEDVGDGIVNVSPAADKGERSWKASQLKLIALK